MLPEDHCVSHKVDIIRKRFLTWGINVAQGHTAAVGNIDPEVKCWTRWQSKFVLSHDQLKLKAELVNSQSKLTNV